MTLSPEDLAYLVRLVRAERTEARRRYESARGEMLAIDRDVDEAERTLAPATVRRAKRAQLVWATNAAEAARARLRRAEAVLVELEKNG